MKNTGKIHKSLRKIPLGGNNVRRKPIRGLLFVFFFFPFILSAQFLTPDATQNIENYLVSERKIGKISVNEKVQFISCNFSAVNADFPNGNLGR